jgi:hypothetical protein
MKFKNRKYKNVTEDGPNKTNLIDPTSKLNPKVFKECKFKGFYYRR